jgi:hypothetical protein
LFIHKGDIMNTVKFEEGRFTVELSHDGFLRIESAPDVSASELLVFKRNLTQHLFSKALMADAIHSDVGADKMLPADEQVEFADDKSVVLDGGKYEVGRTADGRVVALRYGEPWRDCVGDNLVGEMLSLLLDYQDVNDDKFELVSKLDVLINGPVAAPRPMLCDVVSQLESIVAQHNGIPINQLVQFNGLSAAQAERLYLLLEERAESIQAIGKILRHGYESRHPFIEGATTNRQALEKEEGDGCAAMDLLCKAGDINVGAVTKAAISKSESVKQWLHHQEQE